jgi:hypothetical protein
MHDSEIDVAGHHTHLWWGLGDYVTKGGGGMAPGSGHIGGAPSTTPVAPIPPGTSGDLTPYAIPGREDSVRRMQPEFAARIAAMVAQMPPDVRAGFSINNAYRDEATQAALYAASGGSGMVAPPGHSAHSFGVGADLGRSSLAQSGRTLDWIHNYVLQHPEAGLRFPMGNEPWHIEPSDMERTPEGFARWGREHPGQSHAQPPSLIRPSPSIVPGAWATARPFVDPANRATTSTITTGPITVHAGTANSMVEGAAAKRAINNANTTKANTVLQ